MSQDTVFTIYDELRKRALGISDKASAIQNRNLIFSLMAVGYPIDPKQFRAPWSPGAGTGDQASLYNLSQFVDLKLAMDGTGDVMPGSTRISDTWETILNSATPIPRDAEPDPHTVQRVKEAQDYLTKSEDGVPIDDSTVYKAYKTRKARYDEAMKAYGAAYADAAKTPEGLAAWPLAGRVPLGQVDTAYHDWLSFGNKEKVEEALNTIASQGKDAVEAVIANAKAMFDRWRLPVPGNAALVPYVQAFPANWAETTADNEGWTHFHFEQHDTRTEHSDESTSWGGNGGFSFGFWSVGGGGGNQERRIHDEFSSEDLEIDMTFGTVGLARPWLKTMLLNLKGWTIKGQPSHAISNGKAWQDQPPSDEVFWLPSLPTQMVIAKDVRIRTRDIQNTYNYLEQHTNVGGGFGWGPFSLGGSYRRDTFQSSSTAHLEDGWLVCKGSQLIGWISEVMPVSPA